MSARWWETDEHVFPLMRQYGEVVITGDRPGFIRTRWLNPNGNAPNPPEAHVLTKLRLRGLLDDRPGAGGTITRLKS